MADLARIELENGFAATLDGELTWRSESEFLANLLNTETADAREHYSPADGDAVAFVFNEMVSLLQPKAAELLYTPPPVEPGVIY